MASICRRKTTSGARKDFISQLPAELKESILELLNIREATRMAVLSTCWKDASYAHGQLVFNSDFFSYFPQYDNEPRDCIEIINRCLMLRTGPIKKFTLVISQFEEYHRCGKILLPLPADIDRWCLFLSRNGIEELHISIDYHEETYNLHDCIVNCPTIKQLALGGLNFGFPVNSHSVFPGITSLAFDFVLFQPDLTGTVYSVPNLEKLSFDNCHQIQNFVISAPKLKCLTTDRNFERVTDFRWFVLHFADSPDAVATQTFPNATNLRVVVIHNVNFFGAEHFTFIIELIQKCPKLCELGVETKDYGTQRGNGEDVSRLLANPYSCVIKKELVMLKTVKIEMFCGFRLEVQFVKTILLKSPALEELVITKSPHSKDFQILE